MVQNLQVDRIADVPTSGVENNLFLQQKPFTKAYLNILQWSEALDSYSSNCKEQTVHDG